MTTNEMGREVLRLWKAIKRDLFKATEAFVFLNDLEGGNRAWLRMNRNWEALCALDIGLAQRLLNILEQATSSFQRFDDPAGPGALWQASLQAVTQEIEGMAEIVRGANPEAAPETLGDLFRLGEDAIQSEIEHDLGTLDDDT